MHGRQTLLIPALLLCGSIVFANPEPAPARVDRLGQNAGRQWPGKTENEAQIREVLKREEARWIPRAQDTDRYGGLIQGPQLEPTGRFRVAKIKNRWWLITPEGRLFYSIGINMIAPGEQTIVGGRESLYQALPEKRSPAARFYAADLYDPLVKTYNFYRANIENFYGKSAGAPAIKVWRERVLSRMASWGFNTIGNWSEPGLCELHRMSYTAAVTLFEPTYKKRGETDFVGVPAFRSGKAEFADVFSPQFRKHVLSAKGVFADWHTVSYSRDSWCIGVFVDNEVPWNAGQPAERHELARTILADSRVSFGKNAFWKYLSARYRSPAELNQAWGTTFNARAIDDLARQAVTLPDKDTDALRRDLEGLTRLYADRHFSMIRKAFRRWLPATLYLGSRFDGGTPPVVLQASIPYLDVVSFNVYERQLQHSRLVPFSLDKPMLVSEFHFGATDRGSLKGGVITVRNQWKRASAYAKFAESVLKSPAFIGFHWFQYVDEPVNGRYADGENFNCGLVNVVDLPYEELTEVAAEVNRSIPSRLLAEERAAS